MADQQKRRGRTNEPPASVQPAEATIDLMELMYRLLGSWKLIIGLVLVFAIGFGVYTTYYVTPLYSASSTIFVVGRKDSVLNMSDIQIGSSLASDYVEVFKFWEVHDEVKSNLNLPYSYGQLRGMLSVTNTADTRMLRITVTSPKPQEAAQIANEYANVASRFIAETMSTEKPNIMSVALVPTNPISPNKTKNIMTGAILGAILGAGIVLLRMVTDDTYKTAEDIRKYTVLVTLAVIPVEEGEASGSGKGKRKARQKQWKR